MSDEVSPRRPDALVSPHRPEVDHTGIARWQIPVEPQRRRTAIARAAARKPARRRVPIDVERLLDRTLRAIDAGAQISLSAARCKTGRKHHLISRSHRKRRPLFQRHLPLRRRH